MGTFGHSDGHFFVTDGYFSVRDGHFSVTQTGTFQSRTGTFHTGGLKLKLDFLLILSWCDLLTKFYVISKGSVMSCQNIFFPEGSL